MCAARDQARLQNGCTGDILPLQPVARAAFADRLPVEVLQRGVGKGGPTLWTKDVMERNIAYIQEYLLDGILVERGLLDRNKVEAMVSPRIAKSTAIVGDVIAKLYIESWLRKWQQLKAPLEGRLGAFGTR